MKIVRHPKKGKLDRPVVALGTFDGVHLGHRKIIEAAVRCARKIGAHSAVLTFNPHPQQVVAPWRGLRCLTTLEEREDFFAQLGVDAVVVFKFTQHMQNLPPVEFIKRYLVRRLGIRRVFVGYDYAFGRGRFGGITELKRLGRRFGFGVTVISPVKAGGQVVKSAKIRELLSRGDFTASVRLLGHPYRITGQVVRGAGRGRKIGFPTANLKVAACKLIPAQGVYAGFADGKKCVVNIGSRPTFGAGCSIVEVHLLNFNKNMRGKFLSVDLFRRLRSEKQFTDVDELRKQIKKDVVRVRKVCYT